MCIRDRYRGGGEHSPTYEALSRGRKRHKTNAPRVTPSPKRCVHASHRSHILASYGIPGAAWYIRGVKPDHAPRNPSVERPRQIVSYVRQTGTTASTSYRLASSHLDVTPTSSTIIVHEKDGSIEDKFGQAHFHHEGHFSVLRGVPHIREGIRYVVYARVASF